MSVACSVTRRSLLRTCCLLVFGHFVASSNGSEDERSCTNAGEDDRTHTETTFHAATVDRIVDGEHVVLLFEANGQTVGQRVVSRRRLPTVREGDRLLVRTDTDSGDVLATCPRQLIDPG